VRLLDTNVFIRAITNDDPRASVLAQALFGRLENGPEDALVTEAVVAEVVYVLSSTALYGFSRQEVHTRLGHLLSLSGIVVENRSRCLRALDLFVERRQLSFVDALVAATAFEQSPSEVYSFDRGFDRIGGLTRIAPAVT
jgi:predicted nucleic acid-binding protein